ncbi:MAG TPA: putative sulfate exporter family transporter, partial [Candidatus Wallbacteria bacterium]|nr:putative sulfate exporter family transporter [Candidatus Wallbacteria bacterium]
MGVEKKDFIFLSSVIFLIALAAKFMGGVFPVVGGPVFGIIAGIMLSGYFQSRGAQSVFKDMSKNLLQYSIILIGFELDINNVLKVGGNSLALMATTIAFTMALALFLGKMLKLSLNTVLLIGAGTSICGGSAIIATAAVIKAADEEIIHSLSTIFIFNIIAAFVFPLIGSFLQMSDHAFGMWAGT